MQRPLWKRCLVWALLGMLGGAAVVSVLGPHRFRSQYRCARPSELDRELYARGQLAFRPDSVVCFFSKAMRQGDVIGYLPADPCHTPPLSLSPELEQLITLGDDGFFRVADAEGLQAAYANGVTFGTVHCQGETAAKVRLVRLSEPWPFLTFGYGQISGRWFQSSMLAQRGLYSIDNVVREHWDEVERCLPADRPSKRSVDANLVAIQDNQACDVSEHIRDAVLAAVEAAHELRPGGNSDSIQRETSEILRGAASRVDRLQNSQYDRNDLSRQFQEFQRTNSDVPEQVRQAILLQVTMEAKYPTRNLMPLTRHQIWTALRDWPD